uniref:Si:ch211-132g1.3 n=1 Tax=Sinocyclocheilus grahami TaxID=75366 RepID=A0A672LIG0_SINGR
MKMLLFRYSTAVICAVFILTGAVLGQDEKEAELGGTVSFSPAKIDPPVNSIIWKHRSSEAVVKAIEWDDDGFNIPNQRFKHITKLNEKTGEITITNLTISHTGHYTIDINSKEQAQFFILTVMERVHKPVIEIERSSNADVVYLRCGHSETIIWKNSTGETLKGTKNHLPGETITVENTRNPDNYYTCTLKNAVSEKTSDPVFERDLFDESNAGHIVGIIIGALLLLLLIIFLCVYLFMESFHSRFPIIIISFNILYNFFFK